MKRAVGVVVAVAGLACAGPSTVERSFRAFSVRTLDGTVTEDVDLGAAGDLSTKWRGTSQALWWGPLDPDDTLHDDLDGLYGGLRIGLDAVDPRAPALPAATDVRVDGQPGLRFEVRVGPLRERIIGTLWRCPASGVAVSLMTSGLGPGTELLHLQSVASVRCGAEPVGLDRGVVAWAFRGDADQWQREDAEDVNTGQFRRADGEAVLLATSHAAFRDPSLPNLCRDMLKLVHEELSDAYQFDESATTHAETPTGCTHDWAGTRHDDGSATRGRVTYEECGARGFVVHCMAFDPAEPIDSACPAGLFTCAPAGG